MTDVIYKCQKCGYESDNPGSCPNCQEMLVASCPTCGNPLVGTHVNPEN